MRKSVAGAAIGTIAIALGTMHGPSAFAEGAVDPVYRDFVEPPAAARPRVWWHWMNGNVTKGGIKLDLDWMRRVGIGGFQNFDAELLTPQVVEQRLAFMTPPWNEALRYTIDLAEERGLEMAIAASPGWSETGGPWVQPAQAMKKLVWSEMEIAGGKPFVGKLPSPPTVSGPFQDVPQERTLLNVPKPSVRFYADAAVIAYPVVGHPLPQSPIVTSNGAEPVDAGVLSDGILTNSLTLKFGTADAPACLKFDYRRAVSIASMLVAMPRRTDFYRSAHGSPRLEASDDGARFRKIADVTFGAIVQQTISFPAVSARYFRVCFAPPPPQYTDLLSAPAPGANQLGLFTDRGPPADFQISELRLFATPRIHHAEEKAGYAFAENYYALASPPVDAADAVPLGKVVDLTPKMQPDGTLAWTPPAGRWRILRFGYSLTGKENHPATPEATGLEVDKLDRHHVKAYLDAYLGKYENAVGAQRLGAKGIRALLVDSIEVGAQNWTESLPAEFRRRRGYDLSAWMPALTGVVVGSAEQSDRFLYDFRRTLAELIADHHYGQIAATARARGMINYAEALERARPVLGDDMEMRRHATVPMAAMWAYSPEAGAPAPARFADLRGAASVAHIYGQNLVAAESLTSALAPWAHAPRDLKPMMDLEFALGVNRPVIHTSVHQPLIDRPPGLSLAVFGQYFNRNETWAEQAGAWMSYLARTSQLLQQGTFVADVAYFYGEEAPLTALFADHPTRDAPTGHGFDFANSDVLLNRLQVDQGDLVTASGMRYRLLYLGGSSEQMTLPVLRRIEELVGEGATVVGIRPIGSPSLADDRAEFEAIASRLWNGKPLAKGRVIAGRDVDAALAMIGVPRDVDYRKPQPDSEIMFLHRRLADGDVYFLTNRKPRGEAMEMSFRVTGKRPEIWRADDARREPVSYRIENGRTHVSLQFAPHDAFFVVFREPATTTAAVVSKRDVTRVATLSGDWEVSFQPGRGGPASPQKLAAGSWTQSADPAIRYFSGTATYSRSLDVPRSWIRDGARLMLDLGDVRELAEVRVNDRSLGVLWHPPYRIDITDAVRAGGNRIELRVTNLWVNRLIGDAQPGAEKITFTTYPPYEANAPLRASGLLGPVTIDLLATRAPSAAHPSTCDKLKTLSLPNTKIDAVVTTAAGPYRDGSKYWSLADELPEHCRVQATIRPTSDSDIKFEVWLPATAAWNGKLHVGGNGGFAGSINYQSGLAAAVQRGYVGVSTDTGHVGRDEDASWAKGHPEKVIDFGHRALHLATVNAKAIVQAYYGKAAKRSYFMSCSNGGRQALMAAQRYPDDYDGIIAGAPANDWTGLMLSFIWNAQAQLKPGAYIPPSLTATIQAGVNAQCDALDGVSDGVVSTPQACNFQPERLLCAPGQSEQCLTAPQVEALRLIYQGPRTSKGVQLFPGFDPGAEVGFPVPGIGWDGWMFGPEAGRGTQGRMVTSFMRGMITGDENWQLTDFNFDRDPPIVLAKVGPILNATDPDLSAFARRGGKLILFHGWADAAIPPRNSIKYFESIGARMGAQQRASFARLFMVPGMQHCFAGPGPSSFGGLTAAAQPLNPAVDLSAALERWVEEGTAPESVRAIRARDMVRALFDPKRADVERSGVICAYPKQATWNGTGNPADAASYVCSDVREGNRAR